MATALNSVTLAEPAAERAGYQRTEVDAGALHELASGALVYDYVAARYRHSLKWSGITSAERNTIKTQFDNAKTAARSFTSPDGGSYTVLAVPNSWSEEYFSNDGGTTKYWWVGLQLEDSS